MVNDVFVECTGISVTGIGPYRFAYFVCRPCMHACVHCIDLMFA